MEYRSSSTLLSDGLGSLRCVGVGFGLIVRFVNSIVVLDDWLLLVLILCFLLSDRLRCGV